MITLARVFALLLAVTACDGPEHPDTPPGDSVDPLAAACAEAPDALAVNDDLALELGWQGGAHIELAITAAGFSPRTVLRVSLVDGGRAVATNSYAMDFEGDGDCVMSKRFLFDSDGYYWELSDSGDAREVELEVEVRFSGEPAAVHRFSRRIQPVW